MKKCWYLLLLSVVFSCNNNLPDDQDGEKNVKVEEPTDTIKGDRILLDSTKIVECIRCVDSMLITLNAQSPIIDVYNSKNDSLIASFGDVGHAGNEFLEIPVNFYTPKLADGKINLYCPQQTNTKVVNLSSSVEQNSCVIEKSFHNKSDMSELYFKIDNNTSLTYVPGGYYIRYL